MCVSHKSSSASGALMNARTLPAGGGPAVTREPLTRSLRLAEARRWSDDRHQDGCNERQGCAEDERARSAGSIPYPAEDERGRQRAQSDGEVVPAEGGAATNPGDDVRDERFLGAFGHAVENAVHSEQRPRLPRYAGPREGEIDSSVKQPTADDQRFASNTIG